MEADSAVPVDPLGSTGQKLELAVLTSTEISRLKTLEETIEKGLTTFLEVGNALLEIQEGKLYRETHNTFESYMNNRFNLKRKRGYQLIDAAKVINQISAELEAKTTIESGSDAEGYEAVPTGKGKRPKPAQNAIQPVDVDYIEHAGDNTAEGSSDNSEGTFAEQQGEQTLTTSPSSFVWSADDTETEENQKPIPLPETESHAAALSSIPEEKRTEVWTETVKESKKAGKPITAKGIKDTAAKVGVTLNKKAPADRKTTRNTSGKNPVPNDDFSNETLDHTRKATSALNWIAQDEPAEPIEFGADDQAGATGGELSKLELKDKILSAMPGEIMVSIAGSFLVRQGLTEKWQSLRGDDREIDEAYTDKLSIQELVELINL